MSLVTELNQRNVLRVGAAYAVMGWLFVEISSVVLPTFGAPDWVLKVLITLVLLGFPVALIFSWAFELTPDGIKRESQIDRTLPLQDSSGRRLDEITIAAVIIGIAFLIGQQYFLEDLAGGSRTRGASAAATHSIAVLPFVNISDEESNEFFSDGLAEELINAFASIRNLKVAGRTSSFSFKDKNVDLRSIGEALGVETILEGSVRKQGERVRITAQLINAKDGYHLWSETYDRYLDDVFAIQDDIAREVVEALKVNVLGKEEARLSHRQTSSLDAFEAVMRGRKLMRHRTSESLGQAQEQFQAAVDLDSSYALAYVHLADTWMLRAEYGNVNYAEAMSRAQPMVSKALVLDPQMGEGYASLAQQLWSTGDIGGAEIAFKRAIELAPGYSTALHWYGLFLKQAKGDLENALRVHLQAQQLDPLSPVIAANVADDYIALDRFAEARAEAERIIRLDPRYPGGFRVMARLAWHADDPAREVYWRTRAAELDPGNVGELCFLGAEWLDMGDEQRMASYTEQALELAPDKFESRLCAGSLALHRGDFADALQQFRHAQAGNKMGMAASTLALYAGASPEDFLLKVGDHHARLLRDQPVITLAELEITVMTAWALQATGKTGQAAALLKSAQSLIERYPDRKKSKLGIADAQVFALLGDTAAAFAALEDAYQDGYREFWPIWKHDPALARLVDDPRWQELMERYRRDAAVFRERANELLQDRVAEDITAGGRRIDPRASAF